MNRTAVEQQAKSSRLLLPIQGILQRKCACGNKTTAEEECSECAKKKSNLQRKLTIGVSNDPLEREADRVADQVMAMPANSNIGRIPPHIQRFGGESTGQSGTAPVSVERVLASTGRPMEPVLRQDMEQRFGYDFSSVIVHSGEAAEQSAREVSAHAYTVGHNVVFGGGQFAPETHEGRRLIAHELTHVVQQDHFAKPNILSRYRYGDKNPPPDFEVLSDDKRKRAEKGMKRVSSVVQNSANPRFKQCRERFQDICPSARPNELIEQFNASILWGTGADGNLGLSRLPNNVGFSNSTLFTPVVVAGTAIHEFGHNCGLTESAVDEERLEKTVTACGFPRNNE